MNANQRPTRRQSEDLRAYIRAGSIAAAAYELGISETTVRLMHFRARSSIFVLTRQRRPQTTLAPGPGITSRRSNVDRSLSHTRPRGAHQENFTADQTATYYDAVEAWAANKRGEASRRATGHRGGDVQGIHEHSRRGSGAPPGPCPVGQRRLAGAVALTRSDSGTVHDADRRE
ncbi:hypothetical protein BH24CHL9_BH24CHL9_07860 [soil metagenome]